MSSIEMAEVFAINSIAPAILNAKLKPLMEKNIKDLKFIVNVSAMEGISCFFYFLLFLTAIYQESFIDIRATSTLTRIWRRLH